MAVISCNFNGEDYSGSAQDRRYIREYVIQTNSISDGANTVRQYSGLPSPGDSHPADTKAVCAVVGLKQDKEAFTKWIASVQYQIPSRGSAGSTGLSPLDEEPIVSFSGVLTERVAEKAYTTGDSLGAPSLKILNSAGDSFDPPLMIESNDLEIRIQQNLTGLSSSSGATIASDILKYQNTVNDSTFTLVGASCPAESLWIRRINPIPKYDVVNDLDYYEVTWEIMYRKQGWSQLVLDAGFRALFDSDDIPDSSGLLRPVTIADINANETANKKQVQDPVLLNGSGEILTAGSGEYDPNATPVYLNFQTKFPQEWDDLNLPSTLP